MTKGKIDFYFPHVFHYASDAFIASVTKVCNSPDSNISFMMSEPPMNSP